ncbi:MAG TPA: molybdenum cofactor biosynthesis protein MoaE [Acidothermaceae bacterium]|jgi:molybdopterin synthase catalytic subunit
MAEPSVEADRTTLQTPAGVVRLVGIRDLPLSVDEVLAAVADPAAGGTTVFIGTVRSADGGREVNSLRYEAHPDAIVVLRDVAQEVAEKHDAIAIAAVHRTGLLAIGDLAVVVAVAAAHRGEAFAAGKELIDEVKARVPMWK